METRLLHIFGNTPRGRESLLQSAYFCKTCGILPVIYIPKFVKFLMYFENDAVQVDLDASYLNNPETAHEHAIAIVRSVGLSEPNFIAPKHFTTSILPDIPVNFDFMCPPQTISDLSDNIGFGYIGPRVHRMARSARFPMLISSAAFKEWHSIAVFFGGSANALNALRLGVLINRMSGFPLDVFTQEENASGREYKNIVGAEGLQADMDAHVRNRRIFKKGNFMDHLFEVPHDALVILGAYQHGVIKELIFGSMMKKIQAILPNSLLIVGPNFRSPL